MSTRPPLFATLAPLTDSSDDRSIDPETLHAIVAGTAVDTGEAFFDELVKHLAAALGTKCAWVTEWHPSERRLQALSFWVDDGYFGAWEYDVAGTPCEGVVEDREFVHVPERVIELFPRDPDLRPFGAVSYMGVPLFDTDSTILGHLAVLHDEPLLEEPRVRAIFEIFAGRAGAELRRLRRDRDLRDREEKLSRLIGSAMDAIIELDGSLHVTGMNRAAERSFEIAHPEWLGRDFAALLTPDSHAKLGRLTRELESQPEGRQALWIPEGLEVCRSGGESFPAEATLSRFEAKGRPFFTLILRNVDDRLEAEARIRALTDETASLRAELRSLQGFDEIVGESAALRAVLEDIERVATAPSTVLVTGETGTGKELIAAAIHRRSERADAPLVKVNCAAIPANLQESEFFGHERGAFTGATARRQGRFKLADGGTIFLDEVGELPSDLQAKLLRVLQEGEYEPVGSTRTERVDVRVIAATNRDLEAMVEEGSFRRDLFYRLNVFPIRVPPLRERGDDVVLLAGLFASDFARQSGRKIAPLTPDDAARLRRYDWPGNVRELQNVVERAVLTSRDGRRLNLDRALPEALASGAAMHTGDAPGTDRILTVTELRDLERNNLLRALEASSWRISGAEGAAESLGMNPNTLASRIKALGIKRADRDSR
jgi:PAS domain S-box-containing protein